MEFFHTIEVEAGTAWAVNTETNFKLPLQKDVSIETCDGGSYDSPILAIKSGQSTITYANKIESKKDLQQLSDRFFNLLKLVA